MSWFGHHHHNQPAPPASGPNQVFKIFCRANENYCLAVRDGAVVLAPVNPKDDHQHCDKAHGGVHDGTEIVLWKWCEGDNQRWKILPW
ncbi:hydroxyproline-rich glycoprotein family protein [Zea mays]|uniref:Hydroxyproline-rich glycoprotein family protein n=1 Tax=Zea mays TaxID=4577 RepID=A0A1D6IMI3_MAIZE|nr:hydroxyproline-rich glycoprotein family protein [Zea mays]